MSYTTVYKINADWSVQAVGDARNSNGWAMLIWRLLSKKHGHPEFSMGDFPIWKEVGTGKLSPRDELVLVATFDRVWIQKAGLPKFIAALTSYWETDAWVDGRDGLERPVSTILQVIELLKQADASEGSQGACFHTTSLSDDFWTRYNEEEDDTVYYNFERDKGKKLCLGEEPFEMFQILNLSFYTPLETREMPKSVRILPDGRAMVEMPTLISPDLPPGDTEVVSE